MEYRELKTELKLTDVFGGENEVFPGGVGDEVQGTDINEVWNIEGLGAAFNNIDETGDIIVPGAFTRT